MRLCFILGTRPEIIKMAPLLSVAREARLEPFLVHTGQHYDANMDEVFFRELALPQPHVRLCCGGKNYAEQVGYLVRELPRAIAAAEADAVVLQGDTVSVMAGALAAHGLCVPVVHHEAGLRSRDSRMAEEYHRVITDHVSSLACAPTRDAVENLLGEGVPPERIRLTGNTIVDAVKHFSPMAVRTSRILETLDLEAKTYFLLTFHRAENVDDPGRFSAFLDCMARVIKEHPDRPIVFPVHPRIEKRRRELGQEWPAEIRAIRPLGYLDMLRLAACADLIMTDSGGLQEEAAILAVPCVTLREKTERPETVDAGLNIVAGLNLEAVSAAVQAMRGKVLEPIRAYGDGTAAQKIIEAIRSLNEAATSSSRRV